MISPPEIQTMPSKEFLIKVKPRKYDPVNRVECCRVLGSFLQQISNNCKLTSNPSFKARSFAVSMASSLDICKS
jgi:hypothetical protein